MRAWAGRDDKPGLSFERYRFWAASQVLSMADRAHTKSRIFSILKELEDAKIFFRIERTDAESILISAAVPGERWEIQIFENGEVGVEIFASDGTILAGEELRHLIQRHTE